MMRLKYMITLCYCGPMRILLPALALAFALATTSHAQLQRLLPANGKLGQAYGQQHQYPLVQINKDVLRLAPGGVIVDQNNRFSEISRIILLTPEEQARLEQAGKR